MNYKKILIAVDGGPNAERVLTGGFQLGKQLKAAIALISVVDKSILMCDDSSSPHEVKQFLKADFKQGHLHHIAKICKDYPVQTFIEEGKPYEKILAIAKQWEADVIIIGTHSNTHNPYVMMGSVAAEIIKRTKVPLMLVPAL